MMYGVRFFLSLKPYMILYWLIYRLGMYILPSCHSPPLLDRVSRLFPRHKPCNALNLQLRDRAVALQLLAPFLAKYARRKSA